MIVLHGRMLVKERLTYSSELETAPLVLRRFTDAVDDQDLNRALGWLQLQTKLFLNGCEQGGTDGIARSRVCRRTRIEDELKAIIEQACEPDFVHDSSPRVHLQRARYVGERYRCRGHRHRNAAGRRIRDSSGLPAR